jgi:hypothetical protein
MQSSTPSTPIPTPEVAALPRKRSVGKRVLLGLGGALLVLVILVASVIALRHGASSATGNTKAAATPLPGYTANVPGICDKGNAIWLATQGVTVACQSNGAQLSMARGNDSLQGIAFQPANATIPLSYGVAFTGTIIHGDHNVRLFLSVHEQSPGAQIFEVGANGFWNVYRTDTKGQYARSLSLGFLPQSLTSMALSAETDGAVMHFAVNGQRVATVTDAAYLSTASISIGMTDPHGTTPFAARLSNFSYTPLVAPTLGPTSAVATATIQAGQRDSMAYHAATPGYGCDHGGAQWSPIRLSGDDATTLTCTADGMQLAHTRNTGYLSQEQFYWLDGNFPKNYSVTTDLTFKDLNGECGTLIVRRVDLAGYSLRVCTNGFWGIGHYDATGRPAELNDGTTAPKLHYTLEVTAKDDMVNLAVDGVQVGGVTAPTSDLQTNFITLALDVGSSGGIGNATYSNFVFTPLG